MLERISVFWKNDGHELNLLPEVNVWTCGNDGMDVLGSDDQIQLLVDAIEANPDKLGIGRHEAISSDKARTLFEILKAYNPDLADLTDDQIFRDIGAEKYRYTVEFCETAHGKRYWRVGAACAENPDAKHTGEFEAWDDADATENAPKRFPIANWEDGEEIDLR